MQKKVSLVAHLPPSIKKNTFLGHPTCQKGDIPSSRPAWRAGLCGTSERTLHERVGGLCDLLILTASAPSAYLTPLGTSFSTYIAWEVSCNWNLLDRGEAGEMSDADPFGVPVGKGRVVYVRVGGGLSAWLGLVGKVTNEHEQAGTCLKTPCLAPGMFGSLVNGG